jgi:hypothetical protein
MKKIIALLIIGIFILSVWFLVDFRKDKVVSLGENTGDIFHDVTGLEKQSSSEVSTLQPEDIIAKVESELGKKWTLWRDDENSLPLKDGELRVSVGEGSPIYKVEGANFYVSYKGGVTLQVTTFVEDKLDSPVPTTADTQLRLEIADIYNGLGFVKSETIGSKEDGFSTDIYVSQGLICSIESPNSGIGTNTASCGLLEEYKKEVERIKPFAEIIPNVDESKLLTNLAISDSSVSGYQSASLSINSITGGGHVELLYRKIPDSWVYFTGTQAVLPCSMYDTLDLRSAFQGNPCEDDNYQMKTVQ